MTKIRTNYNPSDIGTKALGPLTFLRHLAVVVQRHPQNQEEPPSAFAATTLAERKMAGEWTLVKTAYQKKMQTHQKRMQKLAKDIAGEEN